MLNKRVIYVLIIVLALVLIGSLVAGLYISNEIAKASKGEYLWESKVQADYHVMVILDASNQAYGDAFEKGLNTSGEEFRIAVEIIKVDGSNYIDDVLDVLNMAMYAKVDGVIVHAFSDTRLTKKIEEIHDIGIPVITLNEDLAKSPRISYVGVNRYNIGQAAGLALSKAMNGEGSIAVIEQKSYSDSESLSEDMLILGLRDELKEYPNLTLDLVKYTEQGVLSAETVAAEIFRDNPQINGVFCTDGQNTLGVVQVLVDNNLVNDVVLVGYGDDNEILSYIEKGKIIEGSIVTNYEDIGSEAIKAFYEYKNVFFVSSYINTALQLINEENVTAYLSEKSDEYGKDE